MPRSAEPVPADWRPTPERPPWYSPCRTPDRPAAGRVVAPAVDERARRPRAGHLDDPGHLDGDHDDDRPPEPVLARARPRVRPDDADGRRHGGARVGPRLPARPPAPELPTVRLDHGLVRRPAALPVLHGDPGAGDRGARCAAAVRRGVQADRRRRVGAVPDRLLDVRPARQLPPSDPRALRHRWALLPARRELPDLRRQRQVDDGGRVLVLDRAHARDVRARPARRRPAHGQVPGVRGDRPVARRGLARHRADLRRGQRRHPVPRLVRPPAVRLRDHHRRHDAPAVGLVGRPVPVRPRVHDRHEVRVPPRGGERLVLRHVLPAHRTARHPDHDAGDHRIRRDDHAPQPERHGARSDHPGASSGSCT